MCLYNNIVLIFWINHLNGSFRFTSKIKKERQRSQNFVLGLYNASKTALLKYLSSEAPSTVEEPTKGFIVKTIVKDGFKLNVWDIGGQEAIRTYWENYYDRTDGLVFVVDSSDDYRLDEATSVFKILLSDPKLAKVPILVFAYNQDKKDALCDWRNGGGWWDEMACRNSVKKSI